MLARDIYKMVFSSSFRGNSRNYRWVSLVRMDIDGWELRVINIKRISFAMTDEDLDFLTDLTNRFWHEFSDLCNRYIQEAVDRNPELEAYATMMLGESTSIYGRKT
jgi:hypothetical protein